MIVFRMRTFEEIWKTSSRIELPGLGLLRPSHIGYSPFEPPSYTSSSRQPERSHYLNECTLVPTSALFGPSYMPLSVPSEESDVDKIALSEANGHRGQRTGERLNLGIWFPGAPDARRRSRVRVRPCRAPSASPLPTHSILPAPLPLRCDFLTICCLNTTAFPRPRTPSSFQRIAASNSFAGHFTPCLFHKYEVFDLCL